MISFLFNALQFYNEFNSKKKLSGLKRNTLLLAILYAVICIIAYSMLVPRIHHNMALAISCYSFIIGELIIGILFYKQLKSNTKPMLLQSAQLVKNLIPQTLTGQQKIVLAGASLLVLFIMWPKAKSIK